MFIVTRLCRALTVELLFRRKFAECWHAVYFADCLVCVDRISKRPMI